MNKIIPLKRKKEENEEGFIDSSSQTASVLVSVDEE